MSFYQVVKDRQILQMTNWQIFCCISGLQPIYLMPDGTFRLGNSRGAVARLVTQEWLDKHQDGLEGKSYVEQDSV